MSTKVLLYGRDAHLLETRQWILEGAGFAVFTTESIDEAKRTLDAHIPIVLVLCHTLLPSEHDNLLEMAHNRPQVATLLLEGSGPIISAVGKQDEVLERYRGPKELVSAVTRLAALAQRGASAG